VVACRGAGIVAHVKPDIFDVPPHHFSLAPGETAYPAAGVAIAWRRGTPDGVARLGFVSDGRPPEEMLRSASRLG
jgi:hypothetical protein